MKKKLQCTLSETSVIFFSTASESFACIMLGNISLNLTHGKNSDARLVPNQAFNQNSK